MEREALPVLGRVASEPCPAHKWKLLPCPPVRYDSMVFFDAGADLLVVPWAAFTPAGAIVSNAMPLSLDMWEEDWPLVSCERAHTHTRTRITADSLEGAPAWVRE
eukprot:TRINITY_DN49060_c0_g1_i1.p3 TRINITY_DN49060_c0_g1~~TRINITY_DN49060_c0_g1_i1.p3  ORF type:complete len:117 (-),score=22.56 TRINITY_DN49060_c0_g1_i1:225-539(-)